MMEKEAPNRNKIHYVQSATSNGMMGKASLLTASSPYVDLGTGLCQHSTSFAIILSIISYIVAEGNKAKLGTARMWLGTSSRLKNP
jgi:hypothetical protein